MAIDPQVVPALRLLAQILAEDRRDFVLIGATVPQILVHLWEGGEFRGRPTLDVDALVTAVDWEDFERIRRRLSEVGFRPGSAPHELLFEEYVTIDLIPYGTGVVKNDRLVWPHTGFVMSALGFQEAFAHAEPKEVAPGLSLRVVSIPALLLLKIVAYQDRPEERAHDLIDVVNCLQQYEGEIDGSRRFEVLEVAVDGQLVEFDEAGAYLLGTEVAGLASPRSIEAVRSFLQMISDEYARPIVQIVREEGRIFDNETRGRQLLRLFRVFAAGMEEGAGES